MDSSAVNENSTRTSRKMATTLASAFIAMSVAVLMAGDRLARELVRIRPDVPIIICTGFTRRLDPKQAQMTGVRKVILKPLTMDALAQSVREVLDNPHGQS